MLKGIKKIKKIKVLMTRGMNPFACGKGAKRAKKSGDRARGPLPGLTGGDRLRGPEEIEPTRTAC